VSRDLCSGTSGMAGHPDRACTNPDYTHLIPCCPEAAAKRKSKNMPPHSQPHEGPPTDPKTSTSDHTTTHQDQKNLPQIWADQSGLPHRRAEEHNPHPTRNGEKNCSGQIQFATAPFSSGIDRTLHHGGASTEHLHQHLVQRPRTAEGNPWWPEEGASETSQLKRHRAVWQYQDRSQREGGDAGEERPGPTMGQAG
jgi:hypothetical protein